MLGRLSSFFTRRSSSKARAGSAERSGSVSNEDVRNFYIVLPEGVSPGDTLRVRPPGSDDPSNEVDITVPVGKKPGDKVCVTMRREARGGGTAPRGIAARVAESVGEFYESSKATANSLRLQLMDELEMQRGLWASSETGEFIECGAVGELSQTQALVVVCAEAGDPRQLLAALTEAKRFSAVTASIEQTVRALIGAEESMVTWRCLADAVRTEDRHEIGVWLEQARTTRLEIPADVTAFVEDLRKREERTLEEYARGELERKLLLAVEVRDDRLVGQLLGEAKDRGIISPAIQRIEEQRADEAAIAARACAAAAASGAGASSAGSAASSPSGTGPRAAPASAGSDASAAGAANAASAPTGGRPASTQADAARPPERTNAPFSPPPRSTVAAAPAAPPPVATSRNYSSLTVWERRTPPAQLTTKRGQACFLLGLDLTGAFSAEALRTAYRRAAMECHPDRHQNHMRAEEAKDLFQRVKTAYDFLSKPTPSVPYPHM